MAQIASLVLGLVSLLPALFPLLVQLDRNIRKSNNNSPVNAEDQVPWLLWAFWSTSGMLLGLYFLEVGNDVIALPVQENLVLLFSLICWYQQLKDGVSSMPDGTSTTVGSNVKERILSWIRRLSTSPLAAPFVFVVSVLAVCEIIGLILFAFLSGIFRSIFLGILGVTGALMFLAGLLQLPYDRDMTVNGAFGAFMPISLLAQVVGSFCALIVYSLLYYNSDFVGISVFLLLIFGELGIVVIQSFLRKRRFAMTGESSSYTSVPTV